MEIGIWFGLLILFGILEAVTVSVVSIWFMAGSLAAILAALCGAFLGGAACRVPVVVDGLISGVAALCALRLCPGAQKAMLASHVSREPAGAMMLQALGLTPIIHAGMALGEGTGAVALMPLIDMALAVYHQGSSFEGIQVAAYQPQQP